MAPWVKRPLFEVIRSSLGRLLGRDLEGTSIRLVFLNVPEEHEPGGVPLVSNLTPDWGYVAVYVKAGPATLYRHPHTVAELVAEPLRLELEKLVPEERQWAFRILVPEMQAVALRPTPAVEGVTHVAPYAEGEQPTLRVQRVPEPTPPVATLADFGVSPTPAHREAFVKVLLREPVCRDLETRRFDTQTEEGGFLVGTVYQDGEAEGTYLLELAAAPPAEHTGASLIHFTFTGDSFAAVKRSLRETHSGGRLAGWYHTHLFPATEAMGLSSIDLRLHFTTFRIPWQVAGLVNLDGETRTLRFYVRRGNEMVLCPHWIVHGRA
jgi:hypothetical protein